MGACRNSIETPGKRRRFFGPDSIDVSLTGIARFCAFSCGYVRLCSLGKHLIESGIYGFLARRDRPLCHPSLQQVRSSQMGSDPTISDKLRFRSVSATEKSTPWAREILQNIYGRDDQLGLPFSICGDMAECFPCWTGFWLASVGYRIPGT